MPAPFRFRPARAQGPPAAAGPARLLPAAPRPRRRRDRASASAQTNLLTNGELRGRQHVRLDLLLRRHRGDLAGLRRLVLRAGRARRPTATTRSAARSSASSPVSSYTLTGWVEGDYVYLGDSGTGSSDTSNWTPSAATWTELSTSFTTGASTTSVTIYIHGWYAQPKFYADDLSLTGPAGSGGGGGGGTRRRPRPPTWRSPAPRPRRSRCPGRRRRARSPATTCRENGSQAATVTGTSATVTGLAASTSYTFTVSAYNSAGRRRRPARSARPPPVPAVAAGAAAAAGCPRTS